MRTALFDRISLVFLFETDPENPADEDHRQDDPEHAERISHSIPHRDIRGVDPGHVAVCLLSGSQTGRIGHGAGKNPDHRRNRQTGNQINHVGNYDSQQHDPGSHQVQLDASLLKRGKETRPHLQPDRIDEQDQSEFFQEV